MNTINVSTGFTPFQLCFGKLPQILPPLVPTDKTTEGPKVATQMLINQMAMVEMEAHDALLNMKTTQASMANMHHNLSFLFKVGSRVLLSTFHHRKEYKSDENHHTTKFMPHYDGPYNIISTDEAHSTVTLDLPQNPLRFPVFHTSEVKQFKENDDHLFPEIVLHPPKPALIDGHPEFFICYTFLLALLHADTSDCLLPFLPHPLIRACVLLRFNLADTIPSHCLLPCTISI